MSIMGMKTFTYYFTWFIRYFLVCMFIHIIGSGLLVIAFPTINYGIFLLMLILFDLVLIFQAFFIQIFFTRAKLGIVIGLLFFVIQYVISLAVTTADSPTRTANLLVSVVPQTALTLSLRLLIYADSLRISPRFSDVFN